MGSYIVKNWAICFLLTHAIARLRVHIINGNNKTINLGLNNGKNHKMGLSKTMGDKK